MARLRGECLTEEGRAILKRVIQRLCWENKSDNAIASRAEQERLCRVSSSSVTRVRRGERCNIDIIGIVCEVVGFTHWREYIETDAEREPNSNRSPAPSYTIPFPGSTNFVGRQDTLQALHQSLHAKECVAITAVTGMVGVGKTETAIQYAKRHEADYSGGYCWLNVRESTLALELLKFAQSRGVKIPEEFAGTPLTLQQQVEWFWRNWKPEEGLVLVILDDVTEASWASCIESLPKENRFQVLLTTRSQNLEPNYVEEIPLFVVSLEEALKVLTAFVGEERVQMELEPAKQLCKWLGYLPLGLELVGYYLAEDPDLSLAEMLEQLEAQGITHEALARPQVTWSHAKLGIKPAFELSWKELDAMTQLVGRLLSLFNPDEIPWKLVESVGESLGWKETDINKAKKQLYKLHVVQRVEKNEKKGGYCQIHSLIRDFLHIELERSEQAGDIKRAFVENFVAIAKIIPQSPTQNDIHSVKDNIPHLAEVAKNLTDTVKDEDLIAIFGGLGRLYSGQGLYASAESLYEQCLSVVRSRFGDEHLSVADSFSNLAELYRLQGRYGEAESLYQYALAMKNRLQGH